MVRTGSLPTSPLHGLYHRPLVYESVTGWNDFQPWLDQVKNFPEEVIDQALGQIPRRMAGTRRGPGTAAPDGTVCSAAARASKTNIEGVARRGRIQVFPNWE